MKSEMQHLQDIASFNFNSEGIRSSLHLLTPIIDRTNWLHHSVEGCQKWTQPHLRIVALMSVKPRFEKHQSPFGLTFPKGMFVLQVGGQNAHLRRWFRKSGQPIQDP